MRYQNYNNGGNYFWLGMLVFFAFGCNSLRDSSCCPAHKVAQRSSSICKHTQRSRSIRYQVQRSRSIRQHAQRSRSTCHHAQRSTVKANMSCSAIKITWSNSEPDVWLSRMNSFLKGFYWKQNEFSARSIGHCFKNSLLHSWVMVLLHSNAKINEKP